VEREGLWASRVASSGGKIYTVRVEIWHPADFPIPGENMHPTIRYQKIKEHMRPEKASKTSGRK
jgi:hypothetical protein